MYEKITTREFINIFERNLNSFLTFVELFNGYRDNIKKFLARFNDNVYNMELKNSSQLLKQFNTKNNSYRNSIKLLKFDDNIITISFDLKLTLVTDKNFYGFMYKLDNDSIILVTWKDNKAITLNEFESLYTYRSYITFNSIYINYRASRLRNIIETSVINPNEKIFLVSNFIPVFNNKIIEVKLNVKRPDVIEKVEEIESFLIGIEYYKQFGLPYVPADKTRKLIKLNKYELDINDDKEYEELESVIENITRELIHKQNPQLKILECTFDFNNFMCNFKDDKFNYILIFRCS